MLNNSRVLILATGRSKQFKDGNKLCTVIDGEPMIRRSVAAWQGIGPEIDVLIPSDETEVAELLKDMDVNVLMQDFSHEKSDTAVRDYLHSFENAELSGLFITLGDLYRLDQRELRNLLESYSWRPENMGIVPKFRGERGHPIWLPQSVLADIIESNLTLKPWMEKYPLHMSWLPVDNEAVICDIDTEDDLEFVQSYIAPVLDAQE